MGHKSSKLEIVKGPNGGEAPKEKPDTEVNAEQAEIEQETEEVLEQEKLRQRVIEELKAAANAEARVRTFAALMDTYGVDAIVGLFAEAGDALTSVVSGLYLICEAKKAGLSKTDYLKIMALQAADFAIGAIPIAGDVADFLFKANKRSIPMFEKRTDQLVAEAREAGVSEEAIAKITQAADKLPRLVNHAVHLHKGVKKFKEAA